MDQAAVTIEIAKWAIGAGFALVAMTISIMIYLQNGFSKARHANDNRTTGIINTLETMKTEITNKIDAKYEETRRELGALRREIYDDMGNMRERLAALEHGSRLAEAIDRLVEAKIARN